MRVGVNIHVWWIGVIVNKLLMLGSSFTWHFIGNVQQVWKRKCLPSDPIEIGVAQGTLNHTAGSAWLQTTFTDGRSSRLEKTTQNMNLANYCTSWPRKLTVYDVVVSEFKLLPFKCRLLILLDSGIKSHASGSPSLSWRFLLWLMVRNHWHLLFRKHWEANLPSSLIAIIRFVHSIIRYSKAFD